MSMLVLGSIALDTIETEKGTAAECLGGSATHAALAASYFTRPSLVGVVGDDFPDEHRTFLAKRIDVSELTTLPGRTFRWHGFHSLVSGETTTKSTELNTYEQFKPDLSAKSRAASHVLLGNIDPHLQLHVLDQLDSPALVACDTMSLWIDLFPEKVIEVMRRADLFFINEQESYELTGADNVEEAGKALLAQGAKRAIIKCGAKPSRLFSVEGGAVVPTVPDVELTDPTGAGDNFAGALVGYMECRGATVEDTNALVHGMHLGSATASYAIEAFGTGAHRHLTQEDIERRLASLTLSSRRIG